MSEKSPFSDPLRPVAPQVKWWIVVAVFLLLGAWELFFHYGFMDLPMVTWHRLNVLVGASLVTMTILASFVLIQGYEQKLAAAAAALKEKNEALRALEAERDTRLLDLSRDLALALADITYRCEEARQLPKAFDPVEVLTTVESRASALQSVIRAMVQLRDRGDGLTDWVPAVLEEYEEYLKSHPRDHPLPPPRPLDDGGRAPKQEG
jgi:hypothetical protein